MRYESFDPVWVYGIPRSEPSTSYDYVKDLRYVFMDKDKFLRRFPSGKNRLKNAFLSEGKVIYQIQFHGALTSVYQMAFRPISENIDDFLMWLNKELCD